MNALLNEVVVAAHARSVNILTVNAPTPDFSGPGVSALQTVANVVFAIVLTLAVIGGLIAAGFIVVGHISSNGRVQKMGIVGLVSCVAGVAVAGGIAGLINWGQSLQVA
jgi:cag pathogenicity island protein 25